MTRTKEELTKSWIKKAEKDLLTAKHELSFADAVTESVCFGHELREIKKH